MPTRRPFRAAEALLAAGATAVCGPPTPGPEEAVSLLVDLRAAGAGAPKR